jgi:hypothetical protein
MTTSRYSLTLFFCWFILFRLLISILVFLKPYVPSVYLMTAFCILLLISLGISGTHFLFDSWFKQCANFILELSLIFLGMATAIEEWARVSDYSDTIALIVINGFIVVQVIILIIFSIETIVDIFKWVRLRRKVNKVVKIVHEIEEEVKTETMISV